MAPESSGNERFGMRTIGGERARQALLGKIDIDDFGTKKDNSFSSNSKEDPYQKNLTGSNQGSTLERLYKQFL